MKTRGFIQIPILIAIIIGTALLGGAGYAVYEVAKPEQEAPSEEVVISSNDTEKTEQDIDLASEIQELKQQLADEQKERLKLESTVFKSQTSTVAPPIVEEQKKQPETDIVIKKEEPKEEFVVETFTTPNGAVIDSDGNIISGPTKIIQPTIETNINIGTKILSGAEIYSLVSPSIVLINSSVGSGTGFVVEDGKYTITNAHVVGDNEIVELTFQNGTVLSAPVLGKNDSTDIALIFNHGLNVKPVTFGSSDESSLMTGSEVYALGFPLSYKNVITLTKGIVSANRQELSYGSFIQTDASIHPGNSGGPLVNNKGEVVGINTSVVVAQGSVSTIGGTGIGFAIPIETAEVWIPSLSQYGQSRYELYPNGRQFLINRSLILRMDMNEKLTCSQLGLTGEDKMLCEFYKNNQDYYTWKIFEDL